MIKFKQKNYTLQEGHYTGPKDMEKIPGTISMIGKATLGGSAVGAAVGGVLKETELLENTGLLDGAKKGGKIGFLSGILLKMMVNHLHKPMKKVKFQEVDRMIRKEFGMHRISGIAFGDSKENRKSFDDKFSINDREVTKYKINFCIQNNQVTMYTLDLTSQELDNLNKSIDYYCKKYSGMEYSSRPINSTNNSYSVNIIFTNYDAISSFILELSEILNCPINLMNNTVLPETRIGKEEIQAEERVYSNLPSFSKYDLFQIISTSGAKSLNMLALHGSQAALATLIDSTIKSSLDKLKQKDLASFGPTWIGVRRKEFDSNYLETFFKQQGYVEGMHYTVGQNISEFNISIVQGLVIMTVNKGSKSDLILEKIMAPEEFKKTEVNGKVVVWTGTFKSRDKFNILLKKIVGSLKPNIFLK